MIHISQVFGGRLHTAADLLAKLVTGEAGDQQVDWKDDRILPAVLAGLIRRGFVVELPGDEPVFWFVRLPSRDELLGMDAQLYRELAESEEASNET